MATPVPTSYQSRLNFISQSCEGGPPEEKKAEDSSAGGSLGGSNRTSKKSKNTKKKTKKGSKKTKPPNRSAILWFIEKVAKAGKRYEEWKRPALCHFLRIKIRGQFDQEYAERNAEELKNDLPLRSTLSRVEEQRYGLEIKQSLIPHGGYGVFATRAMKKGTAIPYTGVLLLTRKGAKMSKEAEDYAIQIDDVEGGEAYIMAHNPFFSGVGRWMNGGDNPETKKSHPQNAQFEQNWPRPTKMNVCNPDGKAEVVTPLGREAKSPKPGGGEVKEPKPRTRAVTLEDLRNPDKEAKISMQVVLTKNVKKGEEILVGYGEKYWEEMLKQEQGEDEPEAESKREEAEAAAKAAAEAKAEAAESKRREEAATEASRIAQEAAQAARDRELHALAQEKEAKAFAQAAADELKLAKKRTHEAEEKRKAAERKNQLSKNKQDALRAESRKAQKAASEAAEASAQASAQPSAQASPQASAQASAKSSQNPSDPLFYSSYNKKAIQQMAKDAGIALSQVVNGKRETRYRDDLIELLAEKAAVQEKASRAKAPAKASAEAPFKAPANAAANDSVKESGKASRKESGKALPKGSRPGSRKPSDPLFYSEHNKKIIQQMAKDAGIALSRKVGGKREVRYRQDLINLLITKALEKEARQTGRPERREHKGTKARARPPPAPPAAASRKSRPSQPDFYVAMNRKSLQERAKKAGITLSRKGTNGKREVKQRHVLIEALIARALQREQAREEKRR